MFKQNEAAHFIRKVLEGRRRFRKKDLENRVLAQLCLQHPEKSQAQCPCL
jgi:hypothetical protein